MKTRMKRMGILAFFCICMFATAALAQDVGAEIVTPSENETKIAPGRSFYVMGVFADGAQLQDGDMVCVELINPSGETVRRVSTTIKNNRTMYIDYPGLSYYGDNKEELLIAGMSDLIWDGENESSFYCGDHKLFYDDEGFNALIAGGPGALFDGMDLADGEGRPYEALPEGTYTVRVAVTDMTDPRGDDTDAFGRAEKTIEIGVNEDKILSRFSPEAHRERVTAFAGEKGYRMYTDLFPGYWSDGDVFCEILPAWRAADGTEYMDGKAHFIIYNVKSSSATYSLECAALQLTQAIDDPDRLQCYYYAYGEPTLPDEARTVSLILPFAPGDKLQLVRGETTGGETCDNVYPQDAPTAETYDLDLSDGISAKVGDTVSIYGVTALIQLDPADVVDNGDNSYDCNNKIAVIRYEVQGEGVEQTWEKEVRLNRTSGDWNNDSELEFKHDFPITEEMAGKTLQVLGTGYDAHGELVDGAGERFTIRVSPLEAAADAGGPADAPALPVRIACAVALVALGWLTALLISRRDRGGSRGR